MLERLRPHPVRGDTIAAGAVPLAVAAFLVDLRMTQWGVGARFAVVGLIAALILTMGWLAELEGEAPRAYHSILLLAGLLTLALALNLLSRSLGAHGGDGATTWTFGLEAVIAALTARRFNSGACTLIAAAAGTVAVEAFVAWVFQPHGLGTFRAFLVVLTLAFGGGAVRLRDSARRHAVQLINAAGLLTIALALTLAVSALAAAVAVGAGFAPVPAILRLAGVGTGWKVYVLAVGLGLIAYAAADREPGPAYLGVANLAAFVLLDGPRPLNGNTLVGWPLILLVLGAAGLAVGLRPMQPLPPEPPTRPLPPEPPTEPFDT